MRYVATADTDIGNTKNINQDSLLIKHAKANEKEILLAVICDGMGGLSSGELASATVVRAFNKWFDEELPYELEYLDMHLIGEKWSYLLQDLNSKILEYSKELKTKKGMGTTFTGILFVDDQYVIAHIGDTRVYEMNEGMTQLTTDHTFVDREVRWGNMTPEQAKKDKRRNMLLQCVGASKEVEPQILSGKVKSGGYLLCSDGFRHEISSKEIFEVLDPRFLKDKEEMHCKVQQLIKEVKERRERDNISVIMIKTE